MASLGDCSDVNGLLRPADYKTASKKTTKKTNFLTSLLVREGAWVAAPRS